jgi:hypothetical protein
MAALCDRPKHLAFARLRDHVHILDSERFACSQDSTYVVILVEVLKNHSHVGHTVVKNGPETLKALRGQKIFQLPAINHYLISFEV